MAWGSVQAAVAQVNPQLAGTSAVGVKTVLKDYSPTPTTADFTSVALAVKAAKAQGLYVAMTVSTEIALAADLQQQGVRSRDM